jgi:MFS family permease
VVEVAGDRLILVTSAAQAALFMLNGMLNAFLPLYGRDVLGLAPSAIGWLFAAQTLTILAVRPVVGRLSDRTDRRLVIVAGLITGGCAIFVLPLASATATVVGLILVYAAGVAMTTAAASAFITDVTRQARYGAAHGVFGTIYDIGDAAGPLVAGMLVARVGFAPTFQCVSAVTIATAAVFARIARVRPNQRVNPPRPTREAPQSDRPPTRGEREETRPLRLRR